MVLASPTSMWIRSLTSLSIEERSHEEDFPVRMDLHVGSIQKACVMWNKGKCSVFIVQSPHILLDPLDSRLTWGSFFF